MDESFRLPEVCRLTRQLVDIPSVTGEESEVGEAIFQLVAKLAQTYAGNVERLPVTPGRFNVFGKWGDAPTVTFSTHTDTVPPFIPSAEDENCIYGRGSCDAKGILASMLSATESLLANGFRDIGVLFVVGEERGSDGALAAGQLDYGSRYLVNGEPTENKLALGTKGALRLEVIAKGRMAHSAYPELGESAIDKLLDALHNLREVELPASSLLGKSTLNIGTISGGRAPNVVPDEAKAELLVRLVDDGESTRAKFQEATGGLAEIREVLCIDAKLLTSLPGFETTSVSYTTDIPALEARWGEPFLLGPGSIEVAHTDNERVSKSELREAVNLYRRIALELSAQAGELDR